MLDFPSPDKSTAELVRSRLAIAFAAWTPTTGKKTKRHLAELCQQTSGQECSPQTVQGWFSTGRMDKKWIPVLASILGVDLLSGGDGQIKQEESNVAQAPALSPSRRIPVVGHVKAGPDGYLEEMQYPVGQGEGYVDYWVRDPNAYAVRVKGDSMHPRYRAGEFIVVTPGIEAQPGRDVVVKLLDGRKLLKQLNWLRGDEIQLLSINNGYAPLTISKDEIDSIHRVAGSVPPDAFEPS